MDLVFLAVSMVIEIDLYQPCLCYRDALALAISERSSGIAPGKQGGHIPSHRWVKIAWLEGPAGHPGCCHGPPEPAFLSDASHFEG